MRSICIDLNSSRKISSLRHFRYTLLMKIISKFSRINQSLEPLCPALQWAKTLLNIGSGQACSFPRRLTYRRSKSYGAKKKWQRRKNKEGLRSLGFKKKENIRDWWILWRYSRPMKQLRPQRNLRVIRQKSRNALKSLTKHS